MNRFLAVAAAVVLLQSASMAQASNISFSINVGGPPIVVAQPPEFLYPPELGFGVAVGVPYDMFYLNGVYFVFRGGGWYRTDAYGGSWVRVRYRELPFEFRRYRINRIHEFRDREYRVYGQDRTHYRGRYFRPAAEERREHREMREERRGDRREMREERRDRREERREGHREHGHDR